MRDLHKAFCDEASVLRPEPKAKYANRPVVDVELWRAVMTLSRKRRYRGSKVGMHAAMMPMLTSKLGGLRM